MKDAISSPMCNQCGGPAIPGQISFEEHQLRIENARLKDELNRICALANKFLGRPLSSLAAPIPLPSSASGLELAVGRNGMTIIHFLARVNHDEFVIVYYLRTLLQAGADANATDSDGKLPVHMMRPLPWRFKEVEELLFQHTSDHDLVLKAIEAGANLEARRGAMVPE